MARRKRTHMAKLRGLDIAGTVGRMRQGIYGL